MSRLMEARIRTVLVRLPQLKECLGKERVAGWKGFSWYHIDKLQQKLEYRE